MALIVTASIVAAGPAPGRIESLHDRAFQAAYDLEPDTALALFRQALAASPQDGVAHRGIATVTWLEITLARGTVLVDEFLGSTRPHVNLGPPPPVLARTFREHAERALQLAEGRVARESRSPQAYYELGAAVGLLASYTATVDGRILAAFRSARRAYDAHERVLALDPGRKDAGLTVGTYRYLVSTLWPPTRWAAYLAGFGGGRQRGLRMVEEAAGYPSPAQSEAKYALVLLYNREQRYADALEVLADLRRRYARNRLLWLESGATALRGGRLAEAEGLLTAGLQRLAEDLRPRAFGEDALWHYLLGAVRLERRNVAGARTELNRALAGDARPWVRARTHLALGKLADLDRRQADARGHYGEAVRLARAGHDPATAAEARRLVARPFR